MSQNVIFVWAHITKSVIVKVTEIPGGREFQGIGKKDI